MQNLTPNILTKRIENAVVAGTTDITSDTVDMQGYSSARFIALLGTLTTTHVTKLLIQQSDDDGSADAYSTIATSAQMADGDSNKMIIVEVNHPTKRYLRATVDRGTANAVIDGVIVELSGAEQRPIAKDASVSVQTVVNCPAES
jgi:hypothetical protein